MDPTPNNSDAPLITLDALLALTSLAELEQHYRQQGLDGRDQILARAQQDFHTLAKTNAREFNAAHPEQVEPVSRQLDGRDYHIYGVIHGLIGGDDRDYKDFVGAPIAQAPYVLFENGLNYFYSYKDGVVIPDFIVLGVVGSVMLGINVGLIFPSLLKEMVQEIFKTSKGRDAEEGFAYDRRFHALDPDLRRGLEPDPPLPSHLEIEYELELWGRSKTLARLKDPVALVPRSLFMAGYAVAHARSKGLEGPVPLVVGDLHTMEIARSLEPDSELRDSEYFKLGEKWGARTGLSRSLSVGIAKFIHLSLAGLAGTLIIGPILYLLITAVLWLLA